jgi:hypothetical protein
MILTGDRRAHPDESLAYQPKSQQITKWFDGPVMVSGVCERFHLGLGLFYMAVTIIQQ